MTRARPVAGDEDVGHAFVRMVDDVWLAHGARGEAVDEIDEMRRRVEAELSRPATSLLDFKTGSGGLLDVEFGTQAWLIARRIREPSTPRGLEAMAGERPDLASRWRQGYGLLRRIEATLRRDTNTSVSRLPESAPARSLLAHRLGSSEEDFMTAYEACRRDVRAGYEELVAALRSPGDRGR